MINLGTAALKIFLALEPCEMRKSFNGLTELATRHHQTQPALGLIDGGGGGIPG